jgi:hypothetical protein
VTEPGRLTRAGHSQLAGRAVLTDPGPVRRVIHLRRLVSAVLPLAPAGAAPLLRRAGRP